MWNNYRYTDTEKKKILSSIVFIVDTREKSNEHIIAYFDKHELPYIKRKLDYGDYSFMVKAIPELGILKDVSFENQIVIERKANLEELSGNFSNDRDRIEKEFAICKAKIKLLIENATYSDLVNGNYKTNYKPKSFAGTLFSFMHRYNVDFEFINDNKDTPKYIYCYFYYYLRELIK